MDALPFAPLAWLTPALLAAAGLLAPAHSAPRAWRVALGAAALAPLAALLAWTALPRHAALMLLLVVGIGAVVLRFARRYLDGAPHAARFARWFLLTLAAAATVVVTRDLAVMALAWTATSLSLHRLLVIAEGRAAAEVAAHKKFLLSRIADLLAYGAVALLATGHGTTSIDAVLADVAAAPALAAGDAVAAALLAGAIILRSAQLPFHGWLIQVMEAPTPVSALLHAGVVNLGAFVWIGLAPLLSRASVAQGMLLAAGAATAVLASLAMLAQGSIKGRLAWSTCAQMGFVMIECGLGLPALALLHVVAHGTYKAHGFLRSGSAVQAARGRAPGAAGTTPALGASLLALGLAAAAVWTAGAGLGLAWPITPERLALGAVLTLTLAGLLAAAAAPQPAARRLALLAGALALPALVLVTHALFATTVPVAAATTWTAAAVAALALAALFVTQAAVRAQPDGALARRLHPHAQAGFHLDDVFTRLTFRLWPPTLSETARVPRRERAAVAAERAA